METPRKAPFLEVLQDARAAVDAAAALAPGERAVARRLVRELDEAIVRLEGGDPDKDLVSIICHDLKDPLASIVMGAGFLRKTLPTEGNPARRVTEAIARSADRMSQVVGDFHDLAKLDRGLLSIDMRRCDATAALRSALGSFEADAKERGIALRFEAPPEPVVVVADRARLLQVVAKLVANAARFTQRDGAIVIRIGDVEEPGKSAWARVSVTDNGRGISSERLPLIFDHGANARRTPRDGPGLGLAIVRGLVELHGGEVSVKSRLGEGSTFALTLPRVASPGET